MKIDDISHLSKEEIGSCFKQQRHPFPDDVKRTAIDIIGDVEKRGDRAVIDLTERYDGVKLAKDNLTVTDAELKEACGGVSEAFFDAITVAVERVKRFHEHSIPKEWSFIDEYGNTLGQRYTAIERVGVYIPGGTAVYPSSLVMTVVPAIVAGVRDITIISPPGSFNSPSVLAATIRTICGIFSCGFSVFRIGGVQGIAALGLGTESVMKVDKVVGPGNIWVACAKKELYGMVDIDMIAGPSEVLVVADGSVDPKLTAIDLIAQAEHDERARALCIVFSMEDARAIHRWVRKLTEDSGRSEIVERSLEDNGRIYVVSDEECALIAVNEIAPEHLELHTEHPQRLLSGVKNAGAIFIGSRTAEAFGDYIAGPSHVLPTGGSARFFSPLSATSFMKYSSVVEMSKRGVEGLGVYARTIAQLEGLDGHGRSIDFRGEI
jgi:histidinol dehydrogenase